VKESLGGGERKEEKEKRGHSIVKLQVRIQKFGYLPSRGERGKMKGKGEKCTT